VAGPAAPLSIRCYFLLSPLGFGALPAQKITKSGSNHFASGVKTILSWPGRTLNPLFHLMVSGKVTIVPRVDTAVILVAVPGSTEEKNFEKLQLPKNALTVVVPITGPVVSGPR
jgi:hypothetical protein